MESNEAKKPLRNYKVLTFALAAIALVLIAVVVILLFAKLHTKQSANTATVSKQTAKVTIAPSGIKYPAGWQEQAQINATDKSYGVISEALYAYTGNALTLRSETAALANNFNFQSSADETVAKLKKNLDGFNLVSKKIEPVGGNKAIILTYDQKNGALNYRQTQIIVPLQNKTFYTTISGLYSDFKTLTDKNIADVTNAIGNYINQHKQ
jgi:hypothetical protein